MNYYEELGIRPDADVEEIRKAHRRLVKLMHPDQHRDQALKQLAETQMRRLNSIVATLLDPEEREEYDEELRGEAAQAAPSQSAWRSIPWWIASTLGAIVLTVGAVWFWADRMGSSMRAHPPVVVENLETEAPGKETTTVPVPMQPSNDQPPKGQAESQASSPAKPEPQAFPTEPPQKVSSSAPINTPASELAAPAKTPSYQAIPNEPKPTPRVETAQVAPPVRPPALRKLAPGERPPTETSPSVKAPPEKAKIDGKRKPGDIPMVSHIDLPRQQLELAPAPGASVAPPNSDNFDVVFDNGHIPAPNPSRSSLSHDPLEGEWVYAPTEPEKPKPGLFPPEFIKLKLIKEADGMHGEYNARYNILDKRSISPEVSFALKSVDKSSRKYTWTAADGRHGTFEIRFLESDTMRLEWRTTGGRTGLALNSGMATLVRKN